MAAKSLDAITSQIVEKIIDFRKLQNNITQSIKGAAIDVTDAQELSIPVQVGYTERTQTDSKLIPASDQVLFSVQFLPILDHIITQLIALIDLANDCNQRNSAANTDVDTLETTALRLQFLSLAQEHAMCWKAISNTDMRGISFSSDGLNMIRFREQFLKQSLEDMVATENVEKEANGQATSHVGGDINKKMFDTTLEELTKSTNYLKSSKYYQDAEPRDTLDANRWGVLTTTITSVEEIVKDMRQVGFTHTEAYTPDTKVKTLFVTPVLSFFYCADDDTEFQNAVQTSALLVTTTAITGKGVHGDKQMKEYFYDFIAALFGATKKQTLKNELDKKADMFERTQLSYYTINVPYADIADQLVWPKEVLQKAADQFTRQKTVRVLEVTLKDATPGGVLKPALKDATPRKVLKPALEDATLQKPLQPIRPTTAGKRATTPRPPSGRVHRLGSMLPPASPMPTPPTETPGRKLTPMPVVPTLIQESHLRVPLKAPPPTKFDPDV
ncbi:hypothetical protein T484DRAFT_3639518 [Baffinella frigidus]|nr:hypothetical protein T484DRAFT_3639518 [Cryptophyta sp. CCMP2293]